MHAVRCTVKAAYSGHRCSTSHVATLSPHRRDTRATTPAISSAHMRLFAGCRCCALISPMPVHSLPATGTGIDKSSGYTAQHSPSSECQKLTMSVYLVNNTQSTTKAIKEPRVKAAYMAGNPGEG